MGGFRWRQVYRLRPDLRDHGLRQEVRAQVQADQTTGPGEEGSHLKETAQGEEEQDEEGQGNQEGKGRSRRKEGKEITMFSGSLVIGSWTRRYLLSVVGS